jgi:hypothetical protein
MIAGGKRKRSSVNEYCTNCGKDGGNGSGHTVRYCGYLGGRFHNPVDPDQGRKDACKAKHQDMEAAKKPEAKSAANSQQVDGKIATMAVEIEELKKSVQELKAMVDRNTFFCVRWAEQEFVGKGGKGKGMG